MPLRNGYRACSELRRGAGRSVLCGSQRVCEAVKFGRLVMGRRVGDPPPVLDHLLRHRGRAAAVRPATTAHKYYGRVLGAVVSRAGVCGLLQAALREDVAEADADDGVASRHTRRRCCSYWGSHRRRRRWRCQRVLKQVRMVSKGARACAGMPLLAGQTQSQDTIARSSKRHANVGD